MPLAEERVTLFREEYLARKQMLPGDRMSRVYVFEKDPRVVIDRLEGDKEAYAEMMREACLARDQADAELKALREKVSTWLSRAGERTFGPVEGCDHTYSSCAECLKL